MSVFAPGVHTQRLSSGPRSITAVGTSTTAFIGIFRKGPVDVATRITSWGQFVTTFGGHWIESDASYAIEHYFLNGGSVAYVVRTTWDGAIDDGGGGTENIRPAKAEATIRNNADDADVLIFTAKDVGSWGNSIRVTVATNITTTPNSFDLIIREMDGTDILNEEIFEELSPDPSHDRFAQTIVTAASRLVDLEVDENQLPVSDIFDPTPANPTSGDESSLLSELLKGRPETTGTALEDGSDGVTIVNPKAPTDTAWEAIAAAKIRGDSVKKTGLYALDRITPDRFSLMCIPVTSRMDAGTASSALTEAKLYCKRNYAFLLIGASIELAPDDPPSDISDWFTDIGTADREYSAGLYPRVLFADPEDPSTIRDQDPTGIFAGLIARTDADRGFWKSPAGTETGFAGGELKDVLADLDQVPLNNAGVNCLRQFPVIGAVNWGARTLAGANSLASEHKYMSVARTRLVVEASLRDGLQWVVFEPNGPSLWGLIRMSVTAFMSGLHRRGAFQGTSAKDAFFVKCDSDTTTQGDIDQGIVNVVVGFAPLKPAEYVIVSTQLTTQPAT